ncbi:MAG: tetratricopeptide (TPR) repeat protein [Psychroserpens sp.]|jgi:tetratricopeptide (TPR) repeat protein
MKESFLTLVLCLFVSLGFSQENLKKVFGTISDDFGVLRDVNISIEGKTNTAISDGTGKYEISTLAGDILVFSRMGMLPMEIAVEDVTRVLNIKMYEKTENLEGVTVTKSLKNQKELAIEYRTNPKVIRTAFGYWDADATGFSLRVIDKNQINTGAFDLAAVIQGRFPGIKVLRSAAETKIIFRVQGSLGVKPAGYDIDGLLTEQFPSFIDPQNIDRIAIVASMNGLIRYGTFGKGGIIVINTKTARFEPKDENGEIIDVARVQDNKYFDHAVQNKNAINGPTYLQELNAAKDQQEAISIYNANALKYSSSYFYFLDAYDYFTKITENQPFADNIIAEHWSLFEDNPVALKSLAYMYQAMGEIEKANDIYKEVFILRPNYAQSYLDLAGSYQEIGAYQKAAAIYARYGYLLDEDGFLNDNQKIFTQIMDRELNNLITLKGKQLLSKRDLKKLTLDEYFEGTRLVFEWADSEAEFKLQFVNPENRYFDWSHSYRDNAERIKDEKSLGYATEEYLIDGSLKGNWQVNINYSGNKSLTPTYLKATIYYNYGSPYQSKETKVFKLSLKNVNQRLFTVNSGNVVVSN